MQIRRRSPKPEIAVRALSFQVKTPDAEPRHILEKIVWHKEVEVAQMREQQPLAKLREQISQVTPPLDFIRALRNGVTQPALIAEVKKASPSKGILRQDFDPVAIAQAYESAGASCLSVLTDKKFFQGSFAYLSQIRQAVKLPLLCKEFIVYPYQIYLARVHGADAVLLIAAILSDQDLQYFVKIIKTLGMIALVEVHTQSELDRVITLPDIELIGINNRNLETFNVDLQVTCQLLAQYQKSLTEKGILVVSESGLQIAEDVQTVARAGAHAVLIGESLVKEDKSSTNLGSEAEQMRHRISSLFQPQSSPT